MSDDMQIQDERIPDDVLDGDDEMVTAPAGGYIAYIDPATGETLRMAVAEYVRRGL